MAEEFLPIRRGDIPHVLALYESYRSTGLKLNRLSNDLENYPNCLVRSRDKLAGFAYCYGFAPDIIELANIFVAPEFRGQGLGHRLLDIICANAAANYNGIVAVNSMLYETLEPKKRPDELYRRAGFEIVFQTADSTLFARRLS